MFGGWISYSAQTQTYATNCLTSCLFVYSQLVISWEPLATWPGSEPPNPLRLRCFLFLGAGGYCDQIPPSPDFV